MPAKLTQEEFIRTKEFIRKAIEVHGNKYDYSSVNYIKNNVKITIICKEHGSFLQRPSDHLRAKGCQKCKATKNRERCSSNSEEFIAKSREIYGDRYIYNKTIYVNNHTKVIITCRIHGDFLKNPWQHLGRNSGCQICDLADNIEKMKKTKRATEMKLDDFIKNSNKFHNNYYSYEKIDKEKFRMSNEITIVCPKHGDYQCLIARNHLGGIYCPKCTSDKAKIIYGYTKEEIIKKFKEIHGETYNYSLVKYSGYQNNIKIICKKHGVFEQTPDNHLHGKGCIKCTKNISKPENKWLDLLGIPNDKDHRQISLILGGRKRKVDGFMSNTVYEFYGDYWHGLPSRYNPNDINKTAKKTYGELYKNTLQKEKLIKEGGYQLITIWESDFNKQLKQLRSNS
jgi:hypothetical protein